MQQSSFEPGHFRPPRPWQDHARGFELALDDALNKARAQFGEELERPIELGEVEVTFKAVLTARNPVDIDEYRAYLGNP